jgi:phosphorylcholine metabolism protein LicD
LIEAWEKQGRKIALVNMVDIWKEVQYFTKENMQNLLEAKKEAVDLVVVHNTSLEEVGLSLQMMSLADTNFVLLDSRVTPRKIISKIDLLQQEYKLPNMQFILNKAGYNPNIALQVYRFIKKKFVRYEKISADRPMSV